MDGPCDYLVSYQRASVIVLAVWGGSWRERYGILAAATTLSLLCLRRSCYEKVLDGGNAHR